MKISNDVSKAGGSITLDRLCSAIDTMEELYRSKTTYIRTIIPNRKGLPVTLKTAKEQEALSSKFM